MTKLEFYQSAKEHFSKKANRFNCPANGTLHAGHYPIGLCRFADHSNLGRINKRTVERAIFKRVNQLHTETKNHLTYLYFPKHKQRMDFINEQIEKLTKKK